MVKQRLGDFLIQQGALSQDQAKTIRHNQKTMADAQLAMLLARQGILPPDRLHPLLAEFYGLDYLSLADFNGDAQAKALVPENMAKRINVVPVRLEGNELIVAAGGPLSPQIRENLRRVTGKQPRVAMMSAEELAQALKNVYHGEEAGAAPAWESSISESIQGSLDTVRVVEQILNKAIALEASDIHLEPEPDGLKVRFRIDGVLKTMELLPASMISLVISRIKVMSGMNIAERRAPQDGGLHYQYQEEDHLIPVTARVSIMPSYYGEKACLRIQATQEKLQHLENLGFEPDQLATMHQILEYPHGIFLTCGPSGSGKTTTLYAAMNHLLTDTLNLVTVEDPIERHIKGITQTQIDQKFTFQTALKVILRQDPDVIMVGEIRDGETARLALHSALTGHMVLSTLHTNDAISAVVRLIDMGCEPFLVNSTIHGVLAQRLVRRLCPHCKRSYEPGPDELKILGLNPEQKEVFYTGSGCAKCRSTKYRGRLALYELLVADTEFKRLVGKGADPDSLREYAISNQMRTLREDGILKLRQGLTSAEEVISATTER
ncbi:GspE/PulE family protein [Candidatus Formimonas warabiya]|uniref:Bacterial type II secretion system protein E domain-containing protein n=1 Tax=Formimonas warabiya TaxID=1761012 RepID=A0A3G1KQR0_FORW1|nr:ATPase, T2SS/T4P/T4SS family [Candidatus Formimonas warabiya]ATW24780.1 hypothetical protein DCMF_08345 [Candidatus Formimonas warabiya]